MQRKSVPLVEVIQKLPSTEAIMRRVHNQKNILPSTQDSDSLPKSSISDFHDQNTYQVANPSSKVNFLIYELLPTIVILIVPLSVHAGFFNTLATVFAEEKESVAMVEVTNYSSVHTPLLSATKNPDPLKAIGGGDVFFEDGALVSTGPVGADEIKSAQIGTGEISVYVVREGDALSQIAEMYGVTTNTILWANDITKATDINQGQSLVILPIVGVRHTVGKGETLGTIVKKYEANLEEVLEYNNLGSADGISVGTEIMIPGGELHTAKKVVAKASPTKTSGTKTSGAGLSHPVPGAIKTQGIHGYNGVDLGSAYGTAIRAAAGGTVIVSKGAGWNGGYGNYIVVKHSNGTQTLYAHLSSNAVVAGAEVGQGDVIGAMGNTGKSTGVHLHFEVRGGTNPF
jgi:murein DD-endopeptidase MepM/ murein hydrolase activator NlpD